MVVIQNENRIFINVCLFEFYDKFGFFFDIISAQEPNLLNIILCCRRRTLGRFQWPIIKFEIRSVADFGHGNRKSKSAVIVKIVKTTNG